MTEQTTGHWRGVFAIPPTPFDENGALDEVSLRECVRFCLVAGVHGLVAPVNASEAAYLSERERQRVTEIIIEETQGRVPVVVGVTASCAELAVPIASHAQDVGADAIIAMPPFVQKGSPAEIRAYYSALDNAVSVPIFLQNYGGPGGTPMSAELMAKMLRDLDNVRFVKEETEFSSQLITEIQAVAGPDVEGVMGGKAGRHLLDEFRRGACGTMPACEVADVHVKLWNSLEEGNLEAARKTFIQLLPLLLFETSYGVAVYKEVLQRRGVISHAGHRQVGGKHLDKFALAELDNILESLTPLMTVYGELKSR
ncbi:MAG: dihydrodipicolinate synthase family protein [Trueperaceae bacterium]